MEDTIKTNETKKGPITLGFKVMTSGIAALLEDKTMTHAFVAECFQRHESCDYGVTCKEDSELNDKSIPYKDRIMSAYIDPISKIKVWIITDAGWQTTTILLPTEY